MKLSFLLRESGVAPASFDADIANVTDTLENVRQGSLFVCIRGARVNGAALAPEALLKGAAAVLTEERSEASNAVFTENARLAYSKLCAAFYGRPDLKMRLIGITGTNGKTTTAQYLRFLLEQTGHKCAVIGTLGADTGEGEADTGYTTPAPETFFAALANAAENGCEYCVCEVSSQALAQYRVDGASFALGIFTNVGRDHLDYHRTLSRLVEAKCRLCTLSERLLLNADDAYCDRFSSAAGGKKTSLYSCRGLLSDFSAKNIRPEGFGMGYLLFNGSAVHRVRVGAPGMPAVYNSLCAASAALLEGAEISAVAPLLSRLPAVPGRMERIEKNGVQFVVDFAHTPEALYAALTALRQGKRGRLICVFGCGGNRDPGKRPLMGEAAGTAADTVILTSDNPREEDPEAIIAEIRRGVRARTDVFIVPDRLTAIRTAYEKAAPGDTVLVAGKGHERYQLIKGEKLPFCDADVIRSL